MHNMEGISEQQQLLTPPNPYPWLLFSNVDKTQNFCTISDVTKTYSTMIPELGEVQCMQRGWCLLANYLTENSTELFLWNLSDLTKIKLPLLNHGAEFDGILISSPTTTTGQVDSVFVFSNSSSLIFYWCLGDKHWTEVDYMEQLKSVLALEGVVIEEDEEVCISLSNPFYYNGCLYAATSYWSLLLEIKKVEPHGLTINSSHIFYPKIPLGSFGYISKMLESNNELFQIHISHLNDKVYDVVVHKLDFHGKVWHKVESIKDRVFFISDDTSIVCPAINPEIEGGRVYVTLSNHNFVYIYNIEDKSLMISQPFLDLPEVRSHACWLMIDIRVSDSIKEDMGKTQIREKESNDEIHPKKRKKTVDTVTCDEFALPLDMIQWRSASSDISMSRFDHLSVSPLLVYFEKDNVLTFVRPLYGLTYKYKMNLTMDDDKKYCEIGYSKDGWLVMVVNRHSSSSFSFNPFAREQEILPLANAPTGEDLSAQSIAFSHPPTSSECVVVDLQRFLYCQIPLRAHVAYPGRKEKWHCFDFGDMDFSLYNISPVFHKGAFYYLNEEGKLGVLRVVKEEEQEQEVTLDWDELDVKSGTLYTGYSNRFLVEYQDTLVSVYEYHFAEWARLLRLNESNKFLVECNGNLLLVVEDRFGNWVRVFKLNELTMAWIEVENLENHMLFVGHTSFSIVAQVPGIGNKIYFPRFYREDIVFYSLETKNYHTFESREVVNFHDMREKLNSSWIEPRWQ